MVILKKFLIVLNCIFLFCGCGKPDNIACRKKKFIIENDSIKFILILPEALNFEVDTESLFEYNMDIGKNAQSMPSGKMIFSYRDSLNNNKINAVVNEEDEESRNGFRYFTEFKNVNGVLNHLRIDAKRNIIDDLYKIRTIDINSNKFDSSIIKRELIWYRKSKIINTNTLYHMYYIESIISKKRDINIYFILPPIDFEKADSLISCQFNNPIIKEYYFKN